MIFNNPLMFFGVGKKAGGIQYVGGVTQTYVDTTKLAVDLTSLTGGVGTAPEEGDYVIVLFGACEEGTSPADIDISGYTTEFSQYNSTDSVIKRRTKLLYKKMGSTPDTEISTSAQSNSSVEDCRSLSVMVFRGVNPTTPFDVTAETYSEVDTLIPDPPSITPITSGAVILIGVCGVNRSSISTQYYSSTELEAVISRGSTRPSSGWGAVITALGYISHTSGAFDPNTLDYSGTYDSNSAIMSLTTALRPA